MDFRAAAARFEMLSVGIKQGINDLTMFKQPSVLQSTTTSNCWLDYSIKLGWFAPLFLFLLDDYRWLSTKIMIGVNQEQLTDCCWL